MHEANTKKTKYIMFNIMCKEENIINIVKIKDYLLYIYEVVDTTYTLHRHTHFEHELYKLRS